MRAECRCHCGVVRCRFDHAAIRVVVAQRITGREIFVQIPLLRNIALVVADDHQNRHAILLRQTQASRHGIVVERAVADDADDDIVGPGELDAEGGRHAGAERACPAADVADIPISEQVPDHRRHLRDDLIDDHRAVGQQSVQRVEQQRGVNAFVVADRLALLCRLGLAVALCACQRSVRPRSAAAVGGCPAPAPRAARDCC